MKVHIVITCIQQRIILKIRTQPVWDELNNFNFKPYRLGLLVCTYNIAIVYSYINYTLIILYSLGKMSNHTIMKT